MPLTIIWTILSWSFLAGQAHLDDRSSIAGEVKWYRGKPTIHLNGLPETPVLYALTDVPGGRWSWEELPQHNIQQFCKQGIRLYQLDLFLGDLWKKGKKLSVELAQKQVRGVLEVCPKAAFFFRLHLNPPEWWMEEHLEESVAYDSISATNDPSPGFSRVLTDDPRHPIRASMASQLWKEVMTEQLQAFCTLFSKTQEGNKLVGIQVAYGIYGEWHQWGLHQQETDFSQNMLTHFQEWLKAKYVTETALQRAWGVPGISFQKVKIPNSEERKINSKNTFRDPIQGRKVIDYYECQHGLIAQTIIDFCQTIKDTWPRPIITGTFYGYFFSVFNRQAAGGHLALQKMLTADAIDYLSGPQVYYPEEGNQPGEPYRSRCLNHSILLNGKLWLDEYDQQPRRTWPYFAFHDNANYEKIVQENVAQLQRSVAFSLLKGQGLWFYDFGPSGMHLNKRNQYNSQSGTSGYWDHPTYLQEIGRLKRFADQLLHQEYKSLAEVLVVYDTESIFYLPSTKANPCPITEHLLNWSNLAMHYSGALFDQTHLDDLAKVHLGRYKVVIFMNTFLMDTRERELIQAKVATDNRHVVWVYAPSILDGKELNIEQVSTITEIDLDTFHHDRILQIQMDNAFIDNTVLKAKGPYHPAFFIQDSRTKILGSYLQRPLPAFGFKRLSQYTSWYSGVPITDYRVFQEIFKRAGVSLFSLDKEVIYGGYDWILFHTVKEGRKLLNYQERDYFLDFRTVPGTKFLNLTTGESF